MRVTAASGNGARVLPSISAGLSSKSASRLSALREAPRDRRPAAVPRGRTAPVRALAFNWPFRTRAHGVVNSVSVSPLGVQVTAKEAKHLIEQHMRRDGSGESVQLVDVREPFEVETSNLSKYGWNWTVLPLNSQFSDWQQPVQDGEMLDPSKPTFVLCHHGMRSEFVMRFLSEHCGFDEVYNIMGGINVWSDMDQDIPKY